MKTPKAATEVERAVARERERCAEFISGRARFWEIEADDQVRRGLSGVNARAVSKLLASYVANIRRHQPIRRAPSARKRS